jgi:membrane fusion protein, multidrug efflux system
VQDRQVTVSLTQGDTTIITAGLNPGDTVVTDGQDKLQRGSRIEPRATGQSGRRHSSPSNGMAGTDSDNTDSAPGSGNSGS